MKTFVRIFAAILLVCITASSCQSSLEQQETEIHLVMAPTVLGSYDAPATRAVDLTETGNPSSSDYYYNGFKGKPAEKDLPLGSTVWLMYRKARNSSPDPDNSADWYDPDLHAYEVRTYNGVFSLFSIESETQTVGEVDYLVVKPGKNPAQPLYLKNGIYQFRMVTPANKIRKNDLKMQVDNGMYVYSNDERYEQTKSKVIPIENTPSGFQNIELNPIIAQTARFEIILHPKAGEVFSLDMMSQGIEISGLQNPEAEPNGELLFQWSSLNLADTLKMKRGDKHAMVTIREFTKDDGGSITGETGILPTNAMSTPTVVLINVAVNGIPTQYMLMLSQMKYFHGHSYKLELELGLHQEIYVMNWANQSWTGEVTLH